MYEDHIYEGDDIIEGDIIEEEISWQRGKVKRKRKRIYPTGVFISRPHLIIL